MKRKTKIFFGLLFVLCVIGCIVYFSVEGFSLDTGATLPAIPGVVSTSGPNQWQFVPNPDYFGPVKISYVLSDGGSRTYASSLLLNIKQVLSTISPSTGNFPQGPILSSTPAFYMTSNPNDGVPFAYSFTTEQLWKMINPTGGEVYQNFDRVYISDVQSTLVNMDYSAITPNPPTLQQVQLKMTTTANPTPVNLALNFTSPQITINPTLVNNTVPPVDASKNVIDLNSSTTLTYTVPTVYSSPIKVSITYYLIDSMYYGKVVNQSITPATYYPANGPYTITFIVPWVYKIPTTQPVVITDYTLSEGQQLNLTSRLTGDISSRTDLGLPYKPGNPSIVSFAPSTSPQLSACPNGQTLNGNGTNVQSSTLTDSCRACDVGFYNPNGYGMCIKCQNITGTYADVGSSSCGACPAGYMCTVPNAKTACPAGTYSSAGASSCTNCVNTITNGALNVNNLIGTGNSSGNTSCRTCQSGGSLITTGIEYLDIQYLLNSTTIGNAPDKDGRKCLLCTSALFPMNTNYPPSSGYNIVGNYQSGASGISRDDNWGMLSNATTKGTQKLYSCQAILSYPYRRNILIYQNDGKIVLYSLGGHFSPITLFNFNGNQGQKFLAIFPRSPISTILPVNNTLVLTNDTDFASYFTTSMSSQNGVGTFSTINTTGIAGTNYGPWQTRPVNGCLFVNDDSSTTSDGSGVGYRIYLEYRGNGGDWSYAYGGVCSSNG